MSTPEVDSPTPDLEHVYILISRLTRLRTTREYVAGLLGYALEADRDHLRQIVADMDAMILRDEHQIERLFDQYDIAPA